MRTRTRVGSFGDGQRTLDATREQARAGRFSDGQETSDRHLEQTVVGRYSTGQETLVETPEHLRIGSFGDVELVRPSTSLRQQPATPEGREVETVTR